MNLVPEKGYDLVVYLCQRRAMILLSEKGYDLSVGEGL